MLSLEKMERGGGAGQRKDSIKRNCLYQAIYQTIFPFEKWQALSDWTVQEIPINNQRYKVMLERNALV